MPAWHRSSRPGRKTAGVAAFKPSNSRLQMKEAGRSQDRQLVNGRSNPDLTAPGFETEKNFRGIAAPVCGENGWSFWFRYQRSNPCLTASKKLKCILHDVPHANGMRPGGDESPPGLCFPPQKIDYWHSTGESRAMSRTWASWICTPMASASGARASPIRAEIEAWQPES